MACRTFSWVLKQPDNWPICLDCPDLLEIKPCNTLSKGDLPLALGLGLVLMAVVLLLNAVVSGIRLLLGQHDGSSIEQGVRV